MRSAELVVITETKTNRKWRKNEKLISDARRVDGVGGFDGTGRNVKRSVNMPGVLQEK